MKRRLARAQRRFIGGWYLSIMVSLVGSVRSRHAPARRRRRASLQPADGALRCRRKFLRYFPGGFRDPTYIEWERRYKVDAHRAWDAALGRAAFREMLGRGEHRAAAAHAVRIESRTNLLFSFEKMALRDAVRTASGARRFSEGLYEFLHGAGSDRARFEAWRDAVGALPRRQTRVLTWPLLTVFGFIAQPERHMFLKPVVTKMAAARYGHDFEYGSRPSWEVYESLLGFAARVRGDLRDLRPRDMIDLQSFIWVQGSGEYPGSRRDA